MSRLVVVGDVPSDAVDALEGALAPDTGRWLLLTDPTHEPQALERAGAVLSGKEPTFGLVGLAVLGAGPTVVTRLPGGLPRVALPSDVEAAVVGLGASWESDLGRGPDVPADVAALLASSRVSARTRGIHARRTLPDDPGYAPRALTVAQLSTLREMADVVVPQGPEPTRWLDLAARVDAQLADGVGDGWRHTDLPPDVDAYRAALDELASVRGLDAVLAAVAAGEHPTSGRLDAHQLSLWFEDARVDLVRAWLAHPATMARIGYDGFATGSEAGPELGLGWVDLTPGARESWEPLMEVRS